MMRYGGIDFGSKLAGTTVISFIDNGSIQFKASVRKKDADQFILNWASDYKPDMIFIDAPLSLPGVFTSEDKYADYFYRLADRELKAMSPMFLGGLTARAMQLKKSLEKTSIVREAYPAALARMLELTSLFYKKDQGAIPDVTAKILSALPYSTPAGSLPDWHHVDALLCLLTGHRFLKGISEEYGDPAEGTILV